MSEGVVNKVVVTGEPTGDRMVTFGVEALVASAGRADAVIARHRHQQLELEEDIELPVIEGSVVTGVGENIKVVSCMGLSELSEGGAISGIG